MPARHAICFQTHPLPDDARRRVCGELHGTVVRLGATIGDQTEVHYGDTRVLVETSDLREVEPIRFEVGDAVLYKGELATVRAVLWHFEDGRPMYFVTRGGRKISKRLIESDLLPLTAVDG